jgi:hypothetical protein
MPRSVEQLLQLHLNDGWEPFRTEKDMVVESKAVHWSDTKAFRLTTVFDCSLEAFGTWLSTIDNIYKTDALIEKRVVVEQVNEHTMITYSTYRSPMIGVSKRDAVLEMARLYLSADEAARLGLPAKRTFIEASASAEHASCPPTSTYVRSKVYCAGYIAQEEGTRRISVVNLGSASPEGWVPSKVVDGVGTKLTGKIVKLRQLVESSEAIKAP